MCEQDYRGLLSRHRKRRRIHGASKVGGFTGWEGGGEQEGRGGGKRGSGCDCDQLTKLTWQKDLRICTLSMCMLIRLSGSKLVHVNLNLYSYYYTCMLSVPG